MDLITGLPDDITRECLIRVPYTHFPTVVSASKSWKAEIHLPEFLRRRKAVGFSQNLVVLAQSQVDPGRGFGLAKTTTTTPVYRLSFCDMDSGDWNELPPVPGFSDGLPMFSRVVGCGSGLIIMGGWDPVTWEVCKFVFVYDFLMGEWRRGKDMPGVRRSLFGCGSDCDRTVFVAGGHDEEKNALRSTLVYDVAKDDWIEGGDMARERDECKVIFHRGKFHVIGGYCTDTQGRFETSAEAFDVDTWKWGPLDADLLMEGKCPRTCVAGDDGELYICHEGEVAKREDDKWNVVAKLPAEICNVAYVTAWQGKWMVIGSPIYSGAHTAYVLDLKNYTWKKLDTPEKFSGHVQSGCCLEL